MTRLLNAGFSLLLLISLALSASAFQEYSYTSAKVDFTVEFPSATWKKTAEPDDVHQHTEFIYGERSDGYLRIRKEVLADGMSIQKFAENDQDQRTRFLPGFVDGKSEPFNGRLDGVTLSYEFTQAGKPMVGRSYYLQADKQTVYVLRFTGSKQKLIAIRNQTDFIARSLKLK
ncbi:MAG TPA: hypothetical protein VE961_02200 [Pyrinomonadaceae bacterium]|nr:hypothetical protein [Pyrinomonadaceae bacterium]